jgi:hypothetical protein
MGMSRFYRRRPFGRKHEVRPLPPPEFFAPDDDDEEEEEIGSGGSEAAYLRSLVDSKAKVTLVLKSGEQLHGRIRYYDKDCFSLGPADGGPKIFIRKHSLLYISES